MQKRIVVTIIGSNNYIDYNEYNYFEEKLYQVLEKYFEEEYEIVIKEQEINNIDTFSIRFAKENNCKLERCKIQWDNFGKRAAYENIKILIWGNKASLGTDILVCFYKKKDKKNDRVMCEKIIDEFKSVINITAPINFTNCFIFTKTK